MDNANISSSENNIPYMGRIRNEKGLIIIFSPVILFSLLFIAVDTYSDHDNFEPVYDYFINFYSKRIFLFALIILFWRKIKEFVSGYVLLLIVYLFNILLVLSDSFNIENYLQEYQEKKSGFIFYQNYILRN